MSEKLKEFVVQLLHPEYTDHEIAHAAQHKLLDIQSVCAYHRLKFWHRDALDREGDLVQELPDAIIARPAYRDTQSRERQGRFNMALIDEDNTGRTFSVILASPTPHIRALRIELTPNT